jgi:hypothetical protein
MFDRNLAAKFRAAQPRWSRRLFWCVGVPSFVAWGFAVIRSTDEAPIPIWALVAFAASGVVSVIQWVCYFDRKAD